MSLASLPYFLAKFLVGPTSGYLLATFVPAEGPRNAAVLWGIIGASTMLGPLGIWLGRGWISKSDRPDQTHGDDRPAKKPDAAAA